MPITYFAPTPEAILSAYYKDASGALRHLRATIGIDPEGVTEEDVQLLYEQSYQHLRNETLKLAVVQHKETFVEPVLVLIRGGKA